MTPRPKMLAAILLAGSMTSSVLAPNVVAAAEKPKDERAVALAEWARYKAAWNRHDAQGIASAFAPDSTFTTPSLPQPARGPSEIEAAVWPMLTAFPDLHLVVVSNDWLGEHGMVERWTLTGTWTQRFLSGPLNGASPTGQPFSIDGASFYEWDNGKIRRYETYFDRMSMLRQIGALAAPAVVR